MNPPSDPTPRTSSDSVPNQKSVHQTPLRFGSIFPVAIQILVERGSTIFSILAAASALSVGVGLIFSAFTGFSRNESIDPRTVRFLLTNVEWLALGISVLGMVAVLFLAFDAVIQATDAHLDGKTVSIKLVLGRIKLDHLWLLWIQLIATGLFAIVLPWMALLLWLLVASAVPVAMLEARSPNQALDRAWELMTGNIGKVAVVEIVLTLLLAIPPMILIPLFLTMNAPLGPQALAPWVRMILGIPLLLVTLTPFAYMFVALTVMYRQLRQRTGPQPLHADAAGGVK